MPFFHTVFLEIGNPFNFVASILFYLFSSYTYSGFGSVGIQRASIFLSDTFLSYFQVSSGLSPLSFTQFLIVVDIEVYTIKYVLKLHLNFSLCQYCIENRVIYVIMLYPQHMTVRIYSELISHSVEMLCLVQFFHSCQVLSTKHAIHYQWSVYFSCTHLILYSVLSITVIYIWSYLLFRTFQLYNFDLIQCSVHFSYIHLILYSVPSISVTHLILYSVLSISVIYIWSYLLLRTFQLHIFDLIQCSVHFSYIHLILFTVTYNSVIQIWSYTVFRPFQLYTFDLIYCSVHFS